MTARQIVAIGGGGLEEQVRDYVLGLTGSRPPRVLWVGTASAEDPRDSLRIYDLYAGLAEVTRLEFFPWPPAGLRELVLEHDIVVVGGGNTVNMLAIWRAHGFDRVLREAWEAGVVLTGSSAGMICWFESGVTDSFGPQLAAIHDGLGLLPGSCCPHYDDEELRRPVYRGLVDRGELPAGDGGRRRGGAPLRRYRPAGGRHAARRQAGLPGRTRRRNTARRDAAFVGPLDREKAACRSRPHGPARFVIYSAFVRYTNDVPDRMDPCPSPLGGLLRRRREQLGLSMREVAAASTSLRATFSLSSTGATLRLVASGAVATDPRRDRARPRPRAHDAARRLRRPDVTLETPSPLPTGAGHQSPLDAARHLFAGQVDVWIEMVDPRSLTMRSGGRRSRQASLAAQPAGSGCSSSRPAPFGLSPTSLPGSALELRSLGSARLRRQLQPPTVDREPAGPARERNDVGARRPGRMPATPASEPDANICVYREPISRTRGALDPLSTLVSLVQATHMSPSRTEDALRSARPRSRRSSRARAPPVSAPRPGTRWTRAAAVGLAARRPAARRLHEWRLGLAACGLRAASTVQPRPGSASPSSRDPPFTRWWIPSPPSGWCSCWVRS